MSKKILYVQKNFQNIELAKESLEMALAAASLDLEIGLFFMDDGVFQLLKNQQDDSLSAMLKTLPLYDIHAVYAAEESLRERNLKLDDLSISVTTVSPHQIGETLNKYNIVFS